jgi:hypothetical protein
LPKLPAWLADTPKPIAAANPAAAANVDLKLIVMAPSLSRRDVDARPLTAAASVALTIPLSDDLAVGDDNGKAET